MTIYKGVLHRDAGLFPPSWTEMDPGCIPEPFMTSGVRTADERYTVLGANGGGGVQSITIGRYRWRQWNGGNASTVKKVRKRPQTKKASGLVLPPNPYDVTWEEQHIGCCKMTQKSSAYPLESTGPGAGTFMALPTADPKQLYKLTEKLRRKVYGSDWNPAVFLAEGNQALSMIYNAAVRIGAGIEALRKGDLRNLKNALLLDEKTMRRIRKTRKTGSSGILEVQYGWRPLLSDAEDGATWLAATLDPTRGAPARFVARRNWQTSHKNTNSWGNENNRFAVATVMYSAQVVAYVSHVRSPWLPTITSAASIFWEKLPYSFVADWFVPIGSYVSAMRTAVDLQGTFVQTVKREMTSKIVEFNPVKFKSGFTSAGFDRHIVGRMVRTVSTDFIVPRPWSFATPKEALSLERTINAIALMGQRDWGGLLREFLAHAPTKTRLRP